MSTPADNTRLKKVTRNGRQSEASFTAVSTSKSKCSKSDMPSSREERQVIKYSNQLQSIRNRNKFVSSWLDQTQSFNTKQAVKECAKSDIQFTKQRRTIVKKINSCENLNKDDVECEISAISVNASDTTEVCFNLNKHERRSGVHKVNIKDMSQNSNMLEADSILLGQSAMSGRSSTTKRKIRREAKFNMLKSLHGITPDYESDGYGNDEVSLLSVENENGSQLTEAKRGSIDREERSEILNSGTNENPGNDVVNSNQPTASSEIRRKEIVQSQEEAQEVIDLSIIDQFKKRLDEEDKSVFYDMFELIITKLSVVQNNINQVRTKQRAVNDRVDDLQNTIDVCTQSIDDLDAEMSEVHDANIKVVESIVSTEEQVRNLGTECGKISNKVNRGSFILNGIILNRDQTEKEAVKSFIAEQLEIADTIPVTSAHKMGQARYAPIWFKLEDPDDSAKLFKNVGLLKDKTNSKGKKFRLRNFTDEKAKEEGLRQQDIVMENKRLPESNRVDIAFNKGKLVVNNEIYEKEVVKPSLKEMLLLSREQEFMLDKVQFHQTTSREEDGSFFRAYMREAKSIENVMESYFALAKEHITASSVMCAYRLFGSKFYQLQDYVNANEHGGGRAMLAAIKEAKVWNIVVFVVRYHHRPNLGARRFEIITELTKEAISSYPKTLNYGQYFIDQVTLRILNEAAVRPEFDGDNKRGRGRGGRMPRRDRRRRGGRS